MNKYQITFNTWNKVADLYQTKFMDLDLYDDSYDSFCEKTAPNSKVLEIGCGPGNITKYILDKRPDFDLLAIDVAPNMIDLARQNNPTADFKVMDCREVNCISERFNAIICGFCLPYLSKEDCKKFIKDCSLLLKKDGQFYLSVAEGNYEKSGFQTGSTGDKTYFYYYQEEFLIEELEKNGFVDIELIKKIYPRGKEEEIHLILMSKKN